jgi:hypothetical protein
MKWTKHGLIFVPDNNFEWMASHASMPVADRMNDEVLRILFGTRDRQNRSMLTYIDVSADDPRHVLSMHDHPLLPLGRLGTFDDNGIMPSWIVNHRGVKYLYYIGWNPQVTVTYRLSIGLAVSSDGGSTYRKYSEGPICDRDVDEPYFNTAPCVIVDGNTWRMWYVSCTGWNVIKGKPEPSYHVKYAESSDGIHWRRTGTICIDYAYDDEAIGRPCVVKQDTNYRMLYSRRSTVDYRTDRRHSYGLGYAESPDGYNWIRKDDHAGIDKSASGWDSDMIEYCFVYEHKGRKYMLYNGNDFGRSGIGYATLDEA